MNVSDISPYLLYKFKSESELIKSIQTLSENFTKTREDIATYHTDEKLISAYAAFYLTTNFPKFSHCMNYLKEYESLLKESELIDIGVGPGTFIFAIGDYFNWDLDTLYGIETSHLMKKQAIKIKEGLYPDRDIKIVSSAKSIPKKTKNRIIIFTHSFNEMGIEQARSYIKELDADGVMFIEPGTKSLFKEYLVLRENLLDNNFECAYPCPSNNSCPLKDKDDWCHQYIKVSHDLEVSRLTQLTHKNRKWLPLTLGLYLKRTLKKVQSRTQGRIIRTYPETKFGYSMDVCHNDQISTFETLKRDYSKSESKRIAQLLAGAKISFEVKKELDQLTRVKFDLNHEGENE